MNLTKYKKQRDICKNISTEWLECVLAWCKEQGMSEKATKPIEDEINSRSEDK